jgi:hypothetical protein
MLNKQKKRQLVQGLPNLQTPLQQQLHNNQSLQNLLIQLNKLNFAKILLQKKIIIAFWELKKMQQKMKLRKLTKSMQ